MIKRNQEFLLSAAMSILKGAEGRESWQVKMTDCRGEVAVRFFSFRFRLAIGSKRAKRNRGGTMVTVRRLLELKKKGYWTIEPETTAYEALEIMADKDVGALMVIGEDMKLLGIFTERDYSRKVVLKGRSSKATAVSELMTQHVHCVSPEDTTENCMAIMNDKRVRHLPVIEDGKLAGLVSIRDVVNMIIHEKETTIKDLEQYIRS